LGSGIISWNTCKQKTIASSSCEAEYTVAFECGKEAIWLHMLLSGIGFPPAASTPILCNNNAAINLSEDPSLHQRVKHVDIKFHFLREHIHSGDLKLSYINTHNNLADIFTKALDTMKFEKLHCFVSLL
jgi:short-subunit dehydrogenase involved in D-alanine esterification of teichoic acids